MSSRSVRKDAGTASFVRHRNAGVRITQPGVIGQACNPRQAAGVRVYPPDSYESLVVPYSGQACGNPKVSQLQVKGFGS